MVSRTTDVVGSVGVEAHLGDIVHIEAPIVTPLTSISVDRWP
jgi:hypothetical protein